MMFLRIQLRDADYDGHLLRCCQYGRGKNDHEMVEVYIQEERRKQILSHKNATSTIRLKNFYNASEVTRLILNIKRYSIWKLTRTPSVCLHDVFAVDTTSKAWLEYLKARIDIDPWNIHISILHKGTKFSCSNNTIWPCVSTLSRHLMPFDSSYSPSSSNIPRFYLTSPKSQQIQPACAMPRSLNPHNDSLPSIVPLS